MNTPKFHVATTIDGITVDMRVAIDPVEADLSESHFEGGRLRQITVQHCQGVLRTRMVTTVAEIQSALLSGLVQSNKIETQESQREREQIAIGAREDALKEATAISDPIIARLEAENEKLRNEIGALKTVKAADKPRRTKKSGAK